MFNRFEYILQSTYINNLIYVVNYAIEVNKLTEIFSEKLIFCLIYSDLYYKIHLVINNQIYHKLCNIEITIFCYFCF